MLSSVKLGDQVLSRLAGWGEIIHTDIEGTYPITVRFGEGESLRLKPFTVDGKSDVRDERPEIVEVAPGEWHPKGGNYKVNLGSYTDGVYYDTGTACEKAYFLLRRYARIIAYILEKYPHYTPHQKVFRYSHFVYYCFAKEEYEVGDIGKGGEPEPNFLSLTLPLKVAESLKEDLNSGRVVL